jgi:hypothetical protein
MDFFHLHDDRFTSEQWAGLKYLFNKLEHRIMATMTELQASLQAVSDQLDTDATALQTELNALQAAINAGGATTPAIDALVTGLQQRAAALATLAPTNVTPPPTP